MEELPKGVRLASGYFCRKGWRRDRALPLSRWVSRDRIGDFGFKDAFDEILGLKMLLIEMHDLFAR